MYERAIIKRGSASQGQEQGGLSIMRNTFTKLRIKLWAARMHCFKTEIKQKILRGISPKFNKYAGATQLLFAS